MKQEKGRFTSFLVGTGIYPRFIAGNSGKPTDNVLLNQKTLYRMDNYAVFRFEDFEDKLKKMTKEFIRRVEMVEKKQLAINPYVGKPLGYSFLREKRIGEKRVYYIIQEDKKMVQLVGISGKKDQQEVIDKIKVLIKSGNFKQLSLLFQRLSPLDLYGRFGRLLQLFFYLF